MLAPDSRAVLLRELKPSAGFTFDSAVATTFTLDLTATLIPALAFSSYSFSGRIPDPVAALESVRRTAQRLDVFCQGGNIGVPGKAPDLLAFLEPMVHEVRRPSGGLFHPKVWFVKYTDDDQQSAYRLLVLTRNLTTDASWDLAVRLDSSGLSRRALRENRPLQAFLRSMPGRTIRPLDAERTARVERLATEAGFVEWEYPEAVESVTFHYLDHGREGSIDFAGARHLVVSPFVNDNGLNLIRPDGPISILSRQEELEKLTPESIARLDAYIIDTLAGFRDEPEAGDTLLASARPDTPELTEVLRFTHQWEKAASLDLRFGRAEVISTYIAKERVQEGTTDEMMDVAYLAWVTDVKDGRASILVAEATEMVIRLNRRARADRILANPVGDIEVNLADGTQASEGDLVITRRNDRRLHTLRRGFVRNGDRWTVTRVHKDGSMQVQRLGVDFGGTLTLPAAYVAEHVDLGYAVTAHRAQGMTVDTSHVVVTGSTTRENFYVSMTRGRDSNIAYVALDKSDEGHAPLEPDEVNAHTVLYGVLQHPGGELSAHQMIVAEQERWSSIAQLGAEYETIGAVAQRDRWVDAIKKSGLTEAQVEQVLGSPSFGPLTAELRRAESNHYDIEKLLPVVVARRGLNDAEDIGAVLISRVQKAAQPRQGKPHPSPKLVVGLIPVADGAMSPEMSRVLGELAVLMEGRAMTLAENAAEDRALWLKRLGTPPTTEAARRRWLYEVRTVAAYRDRYNVDGRRVLGESKNEAQKMDAARAEQAIRRARAIADDAASAQDGRSRTLESRGRAIG